MMEVILAIVILIFGVLIWKYMSSNDKGKSITGPKGYPIIGSVFEIQHERLHTQFHDFARRYGKIFSLKMFGAEIVVLNTVDMVDKAFNKQGDIFNNRQRFFVMEHIEFLNTITFNNPGIEHRSARKSFTKGLHVYGSGIPRFEEIVKREINRVVKQIEEYKGQEFEVTDLIKRSLVNIMSILLVGEEATDEDANTFMEYLATGESLMGGYINTMLLNLPFLSRLPYFKRDLDIVVRDKNMLLQKYFHDVKETSNSTCIQGFVYALLQQKEQNGDGECSLTDNKIQSIIISDVFAAGVATTSSTIPNAILCLINHPEYQQKLQEEIDRVIGRDREPMVSDKVECDFTEAVVMETLRYLTPAPFLLPHECSEDTELEGFHVKAKTQVLANAWYIHHDENIWGDPWTFRPDRFLDDKGKLLPNDHLHMKSWIPFGTGRRRCIGNSIATTRIFLYISSLFQKFTFLPVAGKSGSCDPRSENFTFKLLLRPNRFYCVAKTRA